MKFCWCTIHVRNLEESIAFYRDIAGLVLNRRFDTGPDTEIAFLGNGETQVELVCGGQTDVTIGPDISLGFAVDSLDEMLAFIAEKGIAIHSGPFSPNPHTRFFFVQDPNGLKIQFVEQM